MIAYFCGASISEKFDDRSNGIPSHYRVINEHYLLSLNIFRQSAEFFSHPKLTQSCAWLDESSANISIFAKHFSKRDARL